MTYAFDETTPVLDYGPNCRPLRAAKGRRDVLLPALAHRVVAPQPRQRALDLFQQAILKICRARAVTIDQIDAHLRLGRDLIAFIVLQLQSTGLLDEAFRPTHRGLRLLEDDEDSSMEPVVGHVFQDPVSGALWPRFMTEPMNRIAAEFWRGRDAVRRCKYDIGTVGSRRDAVALVVETDSVQGLPAPPAAVAILRACRGHFRQQLSYKRVCARGHELGERLSGISSSELPRLIQQVSVVSAEPEPVFLCTFIFIPNDVSRTGAWQICDPFGLGVSARLRQTAEARISNANSAALRMAIKRVSARAFAVDDLDVAEMVALQRQRAKDAVRAQLGEGIKEYPDLAQHLFRLEDAAAQAEDSIQRPGKPAEDHAQQALATWFARAYTVLEEVLAVVQQAYPPAGTLKMMSRDGEWNACLLSEIALKNLHFAGDEQDQVLGFFKVARGKLDSVVHFDGRDLRSQVAVAVTAANDDSSHPLYHLAREFPSWLSFLADLTDRRRRSVHADRGRLDESEFEPLREQVYRSIRLLLPGLHEAGAQTTDVPGGDPEAWQPEVMHKLRHQASVEVELRTGLGFGQHPELQRFLVEMQTAAAELQHLDGADCPDPIVAELSAEVVLKGACATEAALQLMLAQSQPSDPEVGTGAERSHSAIELGRLARELGFTMAEGELLPECLSMVRVGELKATFSRRRGTLSAMAMVLVQEASESKDHPLRDLARVVPGFLLSLAGIVQQRGHGGSDVRAGRGEALGVVESVYDIVQAVLKVAL